MHEKIDKQSHQDDNEAAAQKDDPSVESAELRLPGYGPLLQFQRLLGYATVLSEMLPLSVAYLFKQLLRPLVVTRHRSP
jgi:hypothetical protein